MFDEIPTVEHSHYHGSRTFTWLANLSGLSVDLVNFLLCQLCALFLASLFRSILHPIKVKSAVRHTFGLGLGLLFGYFCFGQQAIHIAGLPTICYIVIRTQNPEIVQRAVMIVALFYLLCIHLHRQMYDYGSYSLDVTGPLMIITQKVTSLAFSIHDGFTREQKDLTKAQQYHAIHKVPSALEYFSYTLHFQGLLAGPIVFYKDYIDFIEGYNILKNHSSNLDNKNSREIVLEPSPNKAVIKKVIGSIICALIFKKFITIYPIKAIKDDDFVENSSVFYQMWYIMCATTIVRFKYYHAWLLADAICNNSGLGFTGYDKDGNPKWDLISNIYVFGFEFATNMRDKINCWNIGTNRWLRMVVYERVPKKYGTALTFALSAIWHGFYPGYYVTFATGALFVSAARSARRMFRYRFQRTQYTRMFYDIVTCLTTRVVMSYTTFPFVLLEFKASLRMYLKFYMCLHIVAFLTIVVLPKFIRGEKKSQSNSTTEKNELKSNETSHHSISKKSGSSNNNNNYNLHNNHHNYFNENEQNHHNSCLATNSSDAVSVKHDECEMDNLSNKLKEKIELETRNIEELFDKTVTGIVELKDDLMRMNDKSDFMNSTTTSSSSSSSTEAKSFNKAYNNLTSNNSTFISEAGGRLRKRNIVNNNTDKPETVDAFLKKEIDAINAAVQQAHIMPAMLSNGHAK